MEKIIQHLAATAELTGYEISPTALAMMASDLSSYSEDVIIKALAMLRRESKYKMTLASVIEQIEKLMPDGRPGADEAWAMIPRSEDSTAVWTEEMAQAHSVASPLLEEGDKVAARMAFKEKYQSLVEENKRNGIPVKWAVSLGHDIYGRESVLVEAIRLNRISCQHAMRLMPPESHKALIEASNDEVLKLEHKNSCVDHEKASKASKMIKQLLENMRE